MSSVKWQWLWRIFFHVGNHSFLIQCESFFKPPRPSFLIKSCYKTGLEFTEYLKRFVAVKWNCKSPRPTQRPPKWLNYNLFLGHCGGHEEWRKMNETQVTMISKRSHDVLIKLRATVFSYNKPHFWVILKATTRSQTLLAVFLGSRNVWFSKYNKTQASLLRNRFKSLCLNHAITLQLP